MTENEILEKMGEVLKGNPNARITLHELQKVLNLSNVVFTSSLKNLLKKKKLKMHPDNDNWDQIYPDRGNIISVSLNI